MSITCQFSVNLPIHYQSVNPTPIGQSNVNIDESTHLAIPPPDPMPQRPYKDHQNCPAIRGNHKKGIDTGLARIGTTSCQSFVDRRTVLQRVLSTPVKRQSSTRREPSPIRCQSIVNPVSMKHRSSPILCQFSANSSPIHGHQGNANPMSMHSHSCANQVPSHISANPFQSNTTQHKCRSNPLPINEKMTKNDRSMIQFNQTQIHLNLMPIQWPFPKPVCLPSPTICQFSANLPIFDQSIIQLTIQVPETPLAAWVWTNAKPIKPLHRLSIQSDINPSPIRQSNVNPSPICQSNVNPGPIHQAIASTN